MLLCHLQKLEESPQKLPQDLVGLQQTSGRTGFVTTQHLHCKESYVENTMLHGCILSLRVASFAVSQLQWSSVQRQNQEF